MTNPTEQPADRHPDSDAEATIPPPAKDSNSETAPRESAAIDTDSIDETMISPDVPTAAEETLEQTESFSGMGRGKDDARELSGQFGRYRIDKMLGSGAMGAVYLAHDTQLNRAVALKVPTFGERSPANMIERFYREARSAATLTHPNICPVYDVGENEGTHFISMGFIEGRPLSDYIESGKKQAERQAAAVIKKLAMALQEAHDKGIIHRDLKPANVMIDQRSEPIVMDFGLARVTNDQEEAKLTREGTVMGSPAYMAPEQVEGSKQLGPAADIYSLGVVLYELLTGQTPYQGSVVSVIGQVLAAQPKPPEELRNDLSPEVSAICLKAMSKIPADRFASMKEFAQALNAFIKGDSDAIETFVELSGASIAEEFSLDELKKKKATATSMIKAKRYRDAVSSLEGLVDLKGKQGEELANWAKKQLPRAREECEKATEESKSLYRRAKKSMASQDYERASQLLDQIPEDQRNNTVNDLHAEASDLADEVRQLSDEVEYAIESGQNDGMLPTVERLLELKPQHRQANDLYNELFDSARSTKSSSRKSSRSGGSRKGKTQPDPKIIGGGIAGVLLLCGIIYALTGGDDASVPTDTSEVVTSAVPENAEQPSDGLPETAADGPPQQPDRIDSRPFDEDFAPLHDGPGGRLLAAAEALTRLDKNEDGVLGVSEIGAGLLAKIDRNRDDQIDPSELRDAIEAFRGRPGRPRDGQDGFPLPPFDDGPPGDGPPADRPRNDDRPDDRPGNRKRSPEDLFERHDTNGNGVLDGDEIPPFLPPEADLNEDGQISFKELKDSIRTGKGGPFRPPGRPPR